MKYFFIAFMFCALCANAQEYRQQGIDTVFSFKPGTGQNVGQDSVNFPKNIFGLPDTAASPDVPSNLPQNVCSLGMGGEIVVGFKNYKIVNGPGPDFIIFENAFKNPFNDKIFAEPAEISVSKDGINFFPFAYDTTTLKGCAGITPTNGDKNPFNPSESGGDYFDLSDLNISEIRFIKIKDICSLVKNNPNHKYYDPIISGFDLDAVVGIHLEEIYHVSKVVSESNDLFFEQISDKLIIKSKDIQNQCVAYNLMGQQIFKKVFDSQIIIDISSFQEMLTFIVLNNRYIYKVIK